MDQTPQADDSRLEQQGATLGSAHGVVPDGNIPKEALRESARAHARKGSDDTDFDLSRGEMGEAKLEKTSGEAPSRRGPPWRVLAVAGLSVAAVTFFVARSRR